jgi:glyoxylase-like metal-dependent hydrolase (beta-lactamase superfamily II)
MAQQIIDRIWRVGGGELSDDRDCLVYALDLGDPVLVDCGAGPGWPAIAEQLRSVGLPPGNLHTLVLTHGHIDHAGAAARARGESGCRVVAHAADAEVIETGDAQRSAATWYGLDLSPCPVDHRVSAMEDEEILTFAQGELRLIHTPGHTPGSLAALCEQGGKRVLFGQDIHGPFSPAFGSDRKKWRRSMQRLLSLQADVLCEGHFGIFSPATEVTRFIESQLAAHR